MSTLIRDRKITVDDYVAITDDGELPTNGKIVVSWERWQKDAEVLKAGGFMVGVQIPNTLDLAGAAEVLLDRPLIVLSFPSFPDGRAYSQARLLRDRYGYRGELRASGAAVVRDQMHNMMRSGINSFALRADQNPDVCLQAFQEFDAAYQPASDHLVSVLERRRRGISA